MNNIEQDILQLVKSPLTKEKGFNLLVKTYQERLYWNIRRIVISHDDADDILQNTFVKIWRAIDRFQSNSSLYTWLYRISVNESLQHLKQQKRSIFLREEATQNILLERLESDVYFDGNEIQKKLQEAIIRLPEKQRMVFNLKYYDELKYEEISEILGTSVGALKASYHIAIKKLEDFLTNN
ncbi:MAG: RNA polymerase sigma factor [Bacteroidales bacterium]|nr:RNA polymerase sigma factor [Bacteroidales bacterium]